MKNRYAKAEVNVQKITTSLQDHQMRLMKDSAVLEKNVCPEPELL